MTDTTGPASDEPIPTKISASETPVATYGLARAKHGQEDAFHDQVRAFINQVRNDTGCQQYEVHTVTGESGAFMFYERWASGPDLMRHVQQPYMQTYVTGLTELTDGGFQWTWIQPIEP